MEPTRRALGVAGVAALLAALAAVLSRPVLLAGAATVGGWLLARQYRFRRTLATVDRDLTVERTPSRESLAAGEECAVTLTATLPEPVAATVSVATALPAGATGTTAADRRATLAPGETAVETDVAATWPVAGSFSLDPPTVAVADAAGLFRARFRRGPTPTVTVRPRAPRDLHVGRGGDPAASFGDHATGRTGPGVDAAEVREYAAGDPAARIDWAATARLGRPHVREFEVTAAAGTWLVVDAQAPMATGPAGRTAADYARQVALAEVAAARTAGDPVGLTVVGTDGPVARRAPGTGARHYRAVRTHLHDLAVPPDASDAGPSAATEVVADRRLLDLPGGTAMADALAPFVDGRTTTADTDDPLVAAAAGAARGSTPRTVLVTTDADRGAVEAAVRRAREAGRDVAVYLAPAALFDGDGLADAEATAGRYRTFESFRRRVDGLDGVAAYEVAPGDLLRAVARAERGR